MTTINLRKFFYWYKVDEYIEVSDEVAAELKRRLCDVFLPSRIHDRVTIRADTRLWLEWAAQNGNGAGRCGPTGRSRSSRHSHLGTGPQVDAAVPQLPVSPDALPTFPAHHRALIPAGGTEFLTIEGTQFGDGVLLVAEISEKGVPHLESPLTKYSTAKKRLVYRFSCSSVRPRSGLNQTGRSTGRRDRR